MRCSWPMLNVTRYIYPYHVAVASFTWNIPYKNEHLINQNTALLIVVWGHQRSPWAHQAGGLIIWKIIYRVLHTLDVAADNGLTGDFWLARPHWNSMAWLSCNANFPNLLQMYGWVICFEINCTWKQISHRVKFAYLCWPKISLIDENLLGIPASFAGYSKLSHSNCTCSHINVRCEICQDSQHQFHR